tara:strand:+ start:1552 stop:1842 length:291 start_codon:yes stop_codon:yes gene_type:complete
MKSEKEIILKVDPQSRIGVDDVINMLKGLRDETFFEVIKTSQKNEVNNKEDFKSIYNKDAEEKSKSVTGNTNLPQIRELNEIAAILRSMESEQKSF